MARPGSIGRGGWLRDDGLSVLSLLDDRIARLDGEVKRWAAKSEVARLLTIMSGLGWLTALTVVTEVGEIERFPLLWEIILRGERHPLMK